MTLLSSSDEPFAPIDLVSVSGGFVAAYWQHESALIRLSVVPIRVDSSGRAVPQERIDLFEGWSPRRISGLSVAANGRDVLVATSIEDDRTSLRQVHVQLLECRP